MGHLDCDKAGLPLGHLAHQLPVGAFHLFQQCLICWQVHSAADQCVGLRGRVTALYMHGHQILRVLWLRGIT